MSYKVYKMNNNNTIPIIDRVMCALSYLTSGIAGVVWLVITFLVKKMPHPFVMYHVSQSVFLYLFLYILSLAMGLIFDILKNIPFIGDILTLILQFFLTPIYFGFSIVYGFLFLLTVYLAIFTLFGKYAYIPFISNIINRNLRR